MPTKSLLIITVFFTFWMDRRFVAASVVTCGSDDECHKIFKSLKAAPIVPILVFNNKKVKLHIEQQFLNYFHKKFSSITIVVVLVAHGTSKLTAKYLYYNNPKYITYPFVAVAARDKLINIVLTNYDEATLDVLCRTARNPNEEKNFVPYYKNVSDDLRKRMDAEEQAIENNREMAIQAMAVQAMARQQLQPRNDTPTAAAVSSPREKLDLSLNLGGIYSRADPSAIAQPSTAAQVVRKRSQSPPPQSPNPWKKSRKY